MITGVNFGRGLPRSLGAPGVPVASVGNLETYGLFPDVEEERSAACAWTPSARCTAEPSRTR